MAGPDLRGSTSSIVQREALRRPHKQTVSGPLSLSESLETREESEWS